MSSMYNMTNATVCCSFSNVTNVSLPEGCQWLDLSECLNTTTNATGGIERVDRSWIYWLIGPVICVFGIICNILNLCVLLQKELRDSPYMYLTVLAISDVTFLSVCLIHLLLTHAPPSTFKAVYDAYVLFPIGNVLFNSSIWLIVVLSIERTCSVIWPLSTRPTRNKAKLRCLMVVTMCLLINIPRYLIHKLEYRNGVARVTTTEFQASDAFYSLSWFYAVVNNFIPLVTLIGTNSVLMHALRTANRDRKRLRSSRNSSSRNEQTRMNRTCVAIIVLFFVCVVPSAFVEDPIAYSLFGEDKTWHEYLKSPANQTFIYISNNLLFVNSSLNFVLYCAFSSKFRRGMSSFYASLKGSPDRSANTRSGSSKT